MKMMYMMWSYCVRHFISKFQMSIDNDKFQFVELNSTYILKGARLKYTLLPLVFYYVFIKRSFMHANTYLIQRLILLPFAFQSILTFLGNRKNALELSNWTRSCTGVQREVKFGNSKRHNIKEKYRRKTIFFNTNKNPALIRFFI